MSLHEKLEQYKMLVRMYHQTLDLMSERAVADIDTKIRESLVYAQVLTDDVFKGERAFLDRDQKMTLLDLGSGVGLPGVPIAVMCPMFQVILVERRRKRANFLHIVLSQLALENVIIVADDVRDFRGHALADFQLNSVTCVTAQAVGTFLNNYCLTRHLHGDVVTLISRRGKDYQSEVDMLEHTLAQAHQQTLAKAAQAAHNDMMQDMLEHQSVEKPLQETIGRVAKGKASNRATSNHTTSTKKLEPFNIHEVGLNDHACVVAVRLPGRISCPTL